MRLFFMRHAHAVDPQDWRGEEAARPLTEKGRKRARAAATGLARLYPPVGALLTSPYVRAYETAVIVGSVLGLPVETADALAPGFDLSRLDQALALRPDIESMLLVGHEPDLSQIIHLLTQRDETERVVMKKASCCLVVAPEETSGGTSAAELAGRCELAWLRGWRELADMRGVE